MNESNRILALRNLLENKAVSSGHTDYTCAYFDDACIIFAATEKTKTVMIPTDVALEWVMAYDFGIIKLEDGARGMRDKIKDRSKWASYHHGFETHLYAIVKTWADRPTKN